ncbi:hypothetical protein [Zavarzinella formosa]|uniref:hypothetical protein n=1 Tax=Zavarzinella formosa TaxID=360055 RepID=UPI0002DE5518|nr:hypothetical protein [Zavarzinella formosa]
MRYFYTDPLAAAWMSKHFGMRFVYPNGHSADLNHDMSCNWQLNYTRWYICDDSLHLLKRQVSDLVRLQWLDDSISVREWEEIDSCTEEGLDRDVRVRPIVIQRNGMAFHSPEVEP